MSFKRSKLEIYLDLLQIIKKGTYQPTRIMYQTNLSWQPLMAALESMLEQGLIRRNEKGNRSAYEITDKGKNVLAHFREGMKLIEVRS
jgi:predicted transcriptional regulator